jgi:hypothetical protein
MDPYTIDPPTQSTCTSCLYKEDTSNYWTASIYFRSPENGTFKRVPQRANGRLNGTLLEQDGGLTIYYMRPFGGSKNTTAMKPVRTAILLLFYQLILSRRAFACWPVIQPFATRRENPQVSATDASQPPKPSQEAAEHPATRTTHQNSPTNHVQGAFALPSSSRLAGTASISTAQTTRAM